MPIQKRKETFTDTYIRTFISANLNCGPAVAVTVARTLLVLLVAELDDEEYQHRQHNHRNNDRYYDGRELVRLGLRLRQWCRRCPDWVIGEVFVV